RTDAFAPGEVAGLAVAVAGGVAAEAVDAVAAEALGAVATDLAVGGEGRGEGGGHVRGRGDLDRASAGAGAGPAPAHEGVLGLGVGAKDDRVSVDELADGALAGRPTGDGCGRRDDGPLARTGLHHGDGVQVTDRVRVTRRVVARIGVGGADRERDAR